MSIVIANPIFDSVFKRLMEDKRIAKYFIETLINEEIVELSVMPQEYSLVKELRDLDSSITDERIEEIKEKLKAQNQDVIGLTTFRMDFVATIKLPDGTDKKVIIEIQKALTATTVGRFRRYLGEQYKNQDEIEVDGETIKSYLPIISIYLLGFKLTQVECPYIKVARQYIDLVSNEVIPDKNDFIEKLTHDSYIVQIPRIKPKYRTRIEKLLSIFEQDYFLNDSQTMKSYEDVIEDEEIQLMLAELKYLAASTAMRKILDNEIEARYWIEDEIQDAKIRRKKAEKELAAKEQELANKQEELAGKEQELAETEQVLADKENKLAKAKEDLAEKDKDLAEKDKALAEALKLIEELKKNKDN